MNAKLLITATALAWGLSVAGCDVKKTQEGEMPDVNVTSEGGQMPKYDVDAPDVDVTTKDKQVDVPTGVDVQTEQKTVEVPDVNVTPASKDTNDQ